MNICVNSSLLKRAPEVVEFLKKYETTQDMANKFLAYMQDHGSDTGLAAIWFLKNYEPVWTTWVPADVEKKSRRLWRKRDNKKNEKITRHGGGGFYSRRCSLRTRLPGTVEKCQKK